MELLVVMAIILILAALIFPALKTVNATRDETVCLNNMRQIGISFVLYAGEHSYQIPSRVTTTTGGTKWPGLLAKYLGDTRVYAASYDPQNYLIRKVDPLSDTGNNTSYIMNGYNDLGSIADPSVTVRLNALSSAASIILLGCPITGSRQYYMDFEEPPHGNQNDVLNINAFNGGSNYLFADGSARFISKDDYNKPDPSGSNQSYGNTLWLVNKGYQIPKL